MMMARRPICQLTRNTKFYYTTERINCDVIYFITLKKFSLLIVLLNNILVYIKEEKGGGVDFL